MNHFIEKCKSCKIVISQCRCPDPNKEERWSLCKLCGPKVNYEQADEWAHVLLQNWSIHSMNGNLVRAYLELRGIPWRKTK